MKKFRTVLLSILMAVSLLGSTVTAKEATARETENNITVSLATDKQSYEAGEAVSYYLKVDNQKEFWRITKLEIKTNLPEKFSFIEGSEKTFSDMIESGNAIELRGGITNSEATSFTSLSYDEISWDEETAAKDEAKDSKAVDVKSVVIRTIIIIVILDVIFIFGFKSRKKNKKKFLSLFLTGAILGQTLIGGDLNVEASYANPEITLRPYVKVMYGDEEITVRFVVKMTLGQEKASIEPEYRKATKHITCHDPSIFRDLDGKYYVFGSFLATGSSEDLHDWQSNDSVLQGSFSTETKSQIKSWNKDDTAGSWNGYLWAPDVVYNTSMKKYCMYLSANGDDWKSNIVLLTADNAYGPYEYAGTIVYGGFTAEDIGETDALMVLGADEIPDRYVTYGVKNKHWGDMWPNCIDPCTFYDEEGNLWMSYGSWSGGIFMLALDEETGLRDYSVTYENNEHSDAYFGTKIAGGSYVSGEASYIQHIGDYYYLFISYGNLEAKGGYNVRVFRSDRPDGGYVDELGNDAYYDTYGFNYNTGIGVRLFGGYKWRTMEKGEVAQGHNSAFVDEDERAYIVFHTRTTDGSEGHYVKVHQLFVNKEGWLVAAPYNTDGEKRNENGMTMSEAAGKYEMIVHNMDVDFKNLDVNKSCVINLNEDGTITGEYTGTWTIDEGTDYITLSFNDVNYSGVTLNMYIENSTKTTCVFTALGIENQISIWGSRVE